MTTLYILRHSKPIRDNLDIYRAEESTQISNEKNILSVEGEELARKMSEKVELKNIDVVYSSHYTRAMGTAKYIAYNNKLLLNVDERLGERKFGNVKIKDLPKDFFERQFIDASYKLEAGECLNDVTVRMNEVLNEILNKYDGQRIVIVSHGTAISAMLKKWCEIKLNENTKFAEIYFNNKLIFDGNWNCPELFKLVFDNNNLISIENVRY